MNAMKKAGGMLLVMMLLCGLAYTLLLTGVGQVLFPHQANASVITVDGKTYGSQLLGQQFTGVEYLWGRVMQVDVNGFTDADGAPVMYAWPSNLSPASEDYAALVAQRVSALQQASPEMAGTPIPADLVTSSGSGLDPHISPDAAQYQVQRLANARNITPEAVEEAIAQSTTGRLFGLFGEPRVNVLQVNLILDGILEG